MVFLRYMITSLFLPMAGHNIKPTTQGNPRIYHENVTPRFTHVGIVPGDKGMGIKGDWIIGLYKFALDIHNSPEKWLRNGDCRPGNRSKQVQETHTISAAKFEWKTACMYTRTHHKCITFKLCHSYCVSFLDLFLPIAGAITPVT